MTSRYENQKINEGYQYVIGCDEVGRGCLAGPVVAAAVVLNFDSKPKWFSEIKDSKQLSAEKREYLLPLIKSSALWSIAEVSPEVVDKINIHNASLLAMKKAVEGLCVSIPEFFTYRDIVSRKKYPGSRNRQGSGSRLSDALGRDGTHSMFLAVDGKFKIPNLDMEQEAIVGGDNKVLSIAAASIIAKVYRDALMKKFDETFKGYEFARHKGYATEYHRKMVLMYGLSPIHRISFCKMLT